MDHPDDIRVQHERGRLRAVLDVWSSVLSVGVTGTNGKTSTTRWTAACLACLARPVAQATTIGDFLDDERVETTKDYSGFLTLVREAADRGGRFAAIELTSEALARGFARSWPCQVGVFTNLTHDHLDAHQSPEHYLASKAQLFAHLPPEGVAVLNAADPASALLAEVVPLGVRVLRYAVPSRGEVAGNPELLATDVAVSWQGTCLAIEARGELAHAPRQIALRAIGAVYAENALAALTAALACGVPPHAAASALAAAPVPPGRFQVAVPPSPEAPAVVVDYAHTPDALARVLDDARRVSSGQVVVVFGAGGNRDRAKRPAMGAAASRADRIVLTSDNPRDEDPSAIARDVRAGIETPGLVEVELDRRSAIRAAVAGARPGDVVIVAGKGHETTQTIRGTAHPFDDAAEARVAAQDRRHG